MMTMTNKIALICDFLDEQYPNVGCELIYHKDYELVIAVMLSAQTTDIAVNKATEKLFSFYPTLESLANADIEVVEDCIRAIGLYKNKAKNVIGIAQKLLNDFHGVLPSDKDVLQTLPGVGNKTAGVIRAEIFKIPDLIKAYSYNELKTRLNKLPLSAEKEFFDLVDTYKDAEKHKNFLKQLWETLSFKNFDSYHDYLWNEHEMGTLYNKKQRIKAMLDWFVGLKRPIYISVDDYKFILDEEDI